MNDPLLKWWLVPHGQDTEDDMAYVKDRVEVLGQSPDLESSDEKLFCYILSKKTKNFQGLQKFTKFPKNYSLKFVRPITMRLLSHTTFSLTNFDKKNISISRISAGQSKFLQSSVQCMLCCLKSLHWLPIETSG